jgi:hypothetical protein
MDVISNDLLPTSKIGEVTASQVEFDWLIEDLWLWNAAGIIGGQPKVCKSWLGLDMAVSVASQTPCLGRFTVKRAGPSLVYLAEDSACQVQARVAGICNDRRIEVESLNLTLITSPFLRLDDQNDLERLYRTVESIRPRLLLLDPLVRLHRLDENNSRDIASLLGSLRELQRTYDCAVVLTHHASKRATSRPGQGLRGSSDLHAFGDSNLYLSRNGDLLELFAEHRAAAPVGPISLRLSGETSNLALKCVEPSEQTKIISVEDAILVRLAEINTPISRNDLRDLLKINNQRLGQILNRMLEKGAISATSAGIFLA